MISDRSIIFRNAAVAITVFVVLLVAIHMHQGFFLPTKLLIEVQSVTDTYQQVFYDSGHGYNEAESIRLPLKGSSSFETMSFSLPGIKINKFRISPSEKPGNILIRKICIKTLLKQSCQNVLLSLTPTGPDPFVEFQGDFSREQSYITPLFLDSVAFFFSLALFSFFTGLQVWLKRF